jgi:hypothetical protein
VSFPKCGLVFYTSKVTDASYTVVNQSGSDYTHPKYLLNYIEIHLDNIIIE